MMRYCSFNRFLALILCLLSSACADKTSSLKKGDILFQDLDCGDLCDAIEAVTHGVEGKNFSHCGMVVEVNDSLAVIEAIGTKVQLNSLRTFFERSGDTNEVENITVGRLTNKYKTLIPNASDQAISYLGEPYDEVFGLDNGSWYCSELVYVVFKDVSGDDDFFELSPMTYKNSQTGEYYPAWVSYFKKLNTAIPEGELGLNPGSISRSPKLEIIYIEPIK